MATNNARFSINVGTTGLEGTLGVRVTAASGTLLARHTNVTEIDIPSSGQGAYYVVINIDTGTWPSDAVVIWDDGTSFLGEEEVFGVGNMMQVNGGQITLAAATFNNLSTGGNTFRSAYAAGVIEIVQGVDYRSDTIDAIRIARDGGDWPDDLTGYDLTLYVEMTDSYVAAGGTNSGSSSTSTTSVSFSGSGTNTVLIARPGTAMTSVLCPTTPSLRAGVYPYEGQIWGTTGTNVLALWSGAVKVVNDIRSD